MPTHAADADRSSNPDATEKPRAADGSLEPFETEESAKASVMRRWLFTRRRWLLAGGVFLLSLGASLAAIAPLVRAVVESRAAARGLTVRVGTVRPGFGVIRLADVSVSALAVPGVVVTLDRIDVTPTLLLKPRMVAVHGGRIRAEGAAAELADQVRALRSASTPASPDASGREAAFDVHVDGVDAIWTTTEGIRQHAWGLAYRRVGGRESLSVDLIRGRWAGGRLDVRDGLALLERVSGRRVLRSVSAETFLAVADLSATEPDATESKAADSLSRPERPASAELSDAGPAGASLENAMKGKRSAPASGPARGSVVPRDDGAKRDSLPPSVNGAQASPRSSGPLLSAGGRRLRAQFARMADGIRSALTDDGRVELRGVRIQVKRGNQVLNVGPARVVASRDREAAKIALVPGSETQKSPLTLRLRIPYEAGPVAIDVDGGPVRLAALGVQEGDMGLRDVERARLDLKGRLELSADGETVSFTGTSDLSRLTIQHPKLAERPVRGIRLSLQGNGSAALDGTRFVLEDVELGIGKVKAKLSAALVRKNDDARIQARFEVPLAACSNLLESTPEALVPLLRNMQLDGTFSFRSEIDFDSGHPADAEIGWELANACRVTAVSPEIDPARFRQPWVREVEGAGGAPLVLESGPGSPDWVPLRRISRHMETAIIVCEDSRFWSHDGFDQKAIREAIKQNLIAGRFVRGASTVPMQLSKNLYLGRQKTLSRKLQEAVLTVLLEQELGKEEILELYLNVIEFGPDLYGIQQAARHYFNSDAIDLSLGQALYLGSILPNPSRQHFGPDGVVTERWMDYLHRLMRIAHKIHRVTDQELEDGLNEKVEFGVPYLSTTRPGFELRDGDLMNSAYPIEPEPPPGFYPPGP